MNAEIFVAVAHINDMNAHIAEASRQPSEVTEEINKNITQVVDDLGNGTEQLSGASQGHTTLAIDLESQVSHFKI